MIGPRYRKDRWKARRLPRSVRRFISWYVVIFWWVRPVGWLVRVVVRTLGLILGLAVFALVVFSHYERAVTVSGRTEVIAVQGDGTDFSSWTFQDAAMSTDAGIPAHEAITVDLARGATARIVRRGRGAMSVSFTAPETGSTADCIGGTRVIGRASKGEAEPMPLCDDARLVVAVQPGDAPLVMSLRGELAVGEEVRAGAGAQPLLLDGSAQLLVRHGEPFTLLCRVEVLHGLCDRFVATKFELSAGDTLSFKHAERQAEATGFVRLDPDDSAGGLRFDLAAADASLEVRRMKGDAFELSESLFERIEKSPLSQTLNATLLALGLVWWFVRVPGEARSGGASAVALWLIATSLLLPASAQAQQALLRAGETGQAMLRSRADRCYAVTPQHVLDGETTGSLVLERRTLADFDLLRLVPAAPEAMAILLTRAVPADLCPAFGPVPALDGALRARSNGVLRLVRPDGSFDRVPLIVLSVDVETFEVRTQEPSDVLAQGMRGGTVLIDDQPVGLLTDVRDEGRVGRVARLDRVFERLQPYLGAGLAAQTAAPVVTTAANMASMTVARWTAEPVTAANRADDLLADGGPPWRVTDGVASVVFRLGAERAVLTGVLIDAGKLPDPPRGVEVLLGSSERGPWRSVASFALEPGDGIRRETLAPSRAGYAMLRASGHQPGQAAMALTRLGLVTSP